MKKQKYMNVHLSLLHEFPVLLFFLVRVHEKNPSLHKRNIMLYNAQQTGDGVDECFLYIIFFCHDEESQKEKPRKI